MATPDTILSAFNLRFKLAAALLSPYYISEISNKDYQVVHIVSLRLFATMASNNSERGSRDLKVVLEPKYHIQ